MNIKITRNAYANTHHLYATRRDNGAQRAITFRTGDAAIARARELAASGDYTDIRVETSN